VDGVITDRLVGIQGMKAMIGGDRLMMVGDLLRTEEMALAVRKTDQALLDKLNEIISELHSSGRLSEISQKWFDETSSYKILNIPSYLYIWIIRGTPLLLQLFIIYYGLAVIVIFHVFLQQFWH
jgi:ABC-type amino acid transport system permease subunit